MPSTKTLTSKDKPVTAKVQLTKNGKNLYIPISGKLLKYLNTDGSHGVYLTAIDGVIQVSTQIPIMTVSVLTDPESQFDLQPDAN